ncbi:hypothetical protein [Nannocystis sp.]|uniref:hypothetical protein n=1 Tax=Nannocystis sp. TaxID=1962667 RepID=UPI0025E8984D|nr:hypothetical protein [Nannocystis sp.]MBK7828768.1 hypothetical protein [Nannocystis sp.]
MQRTALACLACLLATSTAQAAPPATSMRSEATATTPAATTGSTTDAPAPAPTGATTDAPAPAPTRAAEPPPQRRTGLPPSFAPPGPPRRGRMLMIVGWSVFGGTYALTATLGIIIHNSTRICDPSGESCRRPGLHLLIPVVGPLFLIRDYAETESGPLVTASIMLFQSASLATAIAGTVLYVRDSKRRRLAAPQVGLHLGRGLHLHAAPRLDGGMLQLAYRF